MLDYSVVFLFLFLSRYPAVRSVALMFTVFQLIYMYAVVPLDWQMYYKMTAVVNLLVGIAAMRHNKEFSNLSFLMLPVALIGYFLCKYDFSTVTYDTLARIIITLQAMSLVVRILVSDGNVRGYSRRALVRFVNLYSIRQGCISQTGKVT